MMSQMNEYPGVEYAEEKDVIASREKDRETLSENVVAETEAARVENERLIMQNIRAHAASLVGTSTSAGVIPYLQEVDAVAKYLADGTLPNGAEG